MMDRLELKYFIKKNLMNKNRIVFGWNIPHNTSGNEWIKISEVAF